MPAKIEPTLFIYFTEEFGIYASHDTAVQSLTLQLYVSIMFSTAFIMVLIKSLNIKNPTYFFVISQDLD